jgi:hypothetical protein
MYANNNGKWFQLRQQRPFAGHESVNGLARSDSGLGTGADLDWFAIRNDLAGAAALDKAVAAEHQEAQFPVRSFFS